jgi:hypothetical protein
MKRKKTIFATHSTGRKTPPLKIVAAEHNGRRWYKVVGPGVDKKYPTLYGAMQSISTHLDSVRKRREQ